MKYIRYILLSMGLLGATFAHAGLLKGDCSYYFTTTDGGVTGAYLNKGVSDPAACFNRAAQTFSTFYPSSGYHAWCGHILFAQAQDHVFALASTQHFIENNGQITIPGYGGILKAKGVTQADAEIAAELNCYR